MSNRQWPATTDGIEGAGDTAEAAPGAFAVGDLVIVDGQRYDCVRLTPFWSRRQGREIRLAVFRSLCPDCAGAFSVSVKAICPRPVARVRNKIPRRCPFCRSAGRRVNSVLFLPARRTADGATGRDPGSEGPSTTQYARSLPAIAGRP